MQRSLKDRAIYVLAFLAGAVPFAFAAIRFVQTRSDLRFLWMALAGALGAYAVMAIGKARSQTPGVVLLTFAALAIATVLSGATALLVGGSIGPVSIVAFGFGLCFATSVALALRCVRQSDSGAG